MRPGRVGGDHSLVCTRWWYLAFVSNPGICDFAQFTQFTEWGTEEHRHSNQYLI
jgi:hypothetical protein